MKKALVILSTAVAAFSLASCASAEKMAEQAAQVVVSCNPSPLTLQGGKVNAEITVTYPDKYFNANAILEVTPVYVYGASEYALETVTYQGEKVKDNYTVVPSAGSTVKKSFCFAYKDGMAKGHLELRGRATVNNGKKWVELPVKKAADGIIITETLAGTGYYETKADGYQSVIASSTEGQVLYNINSSVVRNSELKGQSVKELVARIDEVNQNERETLKDIEIVAYASPDGKEEANAKLSDNRSKSADKAFKKVTKKSNVANVNTTVKSVGEDWEGFQEMVKASDIQDKDLIIRVLGMYEDPAVREKEIRNMSSVFQALAKDVLPSLRRARFIANVEYTNYSDEELLKLVVENADVLDESALLKTATLLKANADKKAVLKKAVEKYASKAAAYNLACIALDEYNLADAKACIAKCDAADADVFTLKGVVAFREGNWSEAQKDFQAAGSTVAAKNLGVCAINAGLYAEAAAKCGAEGPDAALANLLNGNLTNALECVKGNEAPIACYLRAIIYARQDKTAEAKAELKKAEACPKLAERAKTDIEFAKL